MTTPNVAMFEITGRDGEALQRFYGDPFDWQIQAGVFGSVLPPTEIPRAGRTVAFFADPDGNVVGLSHGVLR